MDTKTARLNLRLSPEDDRTIRRAAEAQRTTVSEFIVRNALTAAEYVLADRTVFLLEDDRWAELMELLDRAPAEKPELTKLFTGPDPFE